MDGGWYKNRLKTGSVGERAASKSFWSGCRQAENYKNRTALCTPHSVLCTHTHASRSIKCSHRYKSTLTFFAFRFVEALNTFDRALIELKRALWTVGSLCARQWVRAACVCSCVRVSSTVMVPHLLMLPLKRETRRCQFEDKQNSQ